MLCLTQRPLCGFLALLVWTPACGHPMSQTPRAAEAPKRSLTCGTVPCSAYFADFRTLSPDGDEDRDGILNGNDGAPYIAEDIDGVEDTDGIPESRQPMRRRGSNNPAGAALALASVTAPPSDLDMDGIPDAYDHCVNEPEDHDGFEDDDGCLESDNDQDGVADADDPCPTIAGDECTTERVLDISSKVYFKPGSTTLNLGKSRSALREVVALAKRGAFHKLEVRGHTDSMGAPQRNMMLSQQRARAVRLQLIQYGLSPTTVSATGWGATKPIRSNDTEQGRADNRRVEFVVVE